MKPKGKNEFIYRRKWLDGSCLRLTPELRYWTEFPRHSQLKGRKGIRPVAVMAERRKASMTRKTHSQEGSAGTAKDSSA